MNNNVTRNLPPPPPPYVLKKDTRSTRMGGYDNSQLFSIMQQKELKPHRHKSSRTGNHGEKMWFLLPGQYYLFSETRSNTGKGGATLELLTVNEDRTDHKTEPVTEPPEWLATLLGPAVIEDLYPTPYQ